MESASLEMVVYSSEQYGVSFVAEWFHSFPHIDITFSKVNSTFDPTNNEYQEALGVIIAIPGFWLILTLLAFLIFFLCRCCDTGFKKQKSLTPLKWALCIFAVLCCGALAVGLFGNDQAHNGVTSVRDATANMQDIFLSLKNQTTVIQMVLKDDITQNLDNLNNSFARLKPNQTMEAFLKAAIQDMNKNVKLGIEKTDEINKHIDHFNFPAVPQTIHKVEVIRWPVTIALLCLLVIICLVLFWGVVRHSRCLLILFSVLGLLSVVICWVLVSLYLGICVAGSDFCLDPEPFIYEQADGIVDKAALTYYLHCGKAPDPFEKERKEGRKAVDSVESTLKVVTEAVTLAFHDVQVTEILNKLTTRVNDTDKMLGEMEALLNCQSLHKEYNVAMEAACTNVLEGTAFMLVSAMGAGLMFTVLIWLASHTWIHIRKKRAADHVDEEDPFLPRTSEVGSRDSRRNRDTYGSTGAIRPRYSHTPPQTPQFTASLNGRSGSREDQTFLAGRYTPPPAYDQLSGGPLVAGSSRTAFKA